MSQLQRTLSGLGQFLSKTSTQVTETIKRTNSRNNFSVIDSDEEGHDMQRIFLESAHVVINGEKTELNCKGVTRLRMPKGAEYVVHLSIFTADDHSLPLYFEETTESLGKKHVVVLKLDEKFVANEKKPIQCPPRTASTSMMSSTRVCIKIKEKDAKKHILKLEFIYE